MRHLNRVLTRNKQTENVTLTSRCIIFSRLLLKWILNILFIICNRAAKQTIIFLIDQFFFLSKM